MRYFFDILERSGVTRDPEGMNLRAREDMRREAKRILAQIAVDEPYPGDELALSLRVRDEAGHVVYNLCLSIREECSP